jgi:hypothetical protein
MTPDPVVDEIRAIRDELAKEFNYDIAEIFDALRRMEREEASAPITLPARPSVARTRDSAAQPAVAPDEPGSSAAGSRG